MSVWSLVTSEPAFPRSLLLMPCSSTSQRAPLYAAEVMTSRRDLCLSLPAFALLSDVYAQQPGIPAAQGSKPDPEKIARGTEVFAHNQVFRSAEQPLQPGKATSIQSDNQGALITGEGVEMHNTVLAAGQEPHPPHRHEHSEWLLIREGQVTWMIDGQPQPAGPGDICYAASMQMHGIRNTGSTPARYFVMAAGPNLKG